MLLVFSLQRWTANASRAAITGRSRNLPLNVDPLPASGAALFLPRSLRLKTRTAGITEPSVFWASVQIPTYIRPLIRNRGKPLLASLALGILVIHTHQRRGRVHVLAVEASPGGSGREYLSSRAGRARHAQILRHCLQVTPISLQHPLHRYKAAWIRAKALISSAT